MTIDFHMALVRRGTPKGLADIPQLNVLSDDVACLQFVCDALANQDFLDFHVSGFGDPAWPVDVRTDLSVIIEQIPGVLGQLELGLGCSLDFYEQGIERRISLNPNLDKTLAECHCDLSWTPVPSKIEISKTELMLMFENFVADFLKYTALLESDGLTSQATKILRSSS